MENLPTPQEAVEVGETREAKYAHLVSELQSLTTMLLVQLVLFKLVQSTRSGTCT